MISQVAIFAHNEAPRIARALAALPPGLDVHVLVNGATDGTAEVARDAAGEGTTVHDLPWAGKARTWNHALDNLWDGRSPLLFSDGDCWMERDTPARLAEALAASPQANAASAAPWGGRRAAAYRARMAKERGLFGAAYMLSPDFLRRFRDSGIRLPWGLVGDDGLVAGLAKTDLGPDADWRDERVLFVEGARVHTDPMALTPRALAGQARRMVRYAVRRYQNQGITALMGGPGPAALPRHAGELTRGRALRPRLAHLPFDLLAIRAVREAEALVSPR